MPKILVTGWRGFIGSHVVDMLSEQRYSYRLFHGDVTDPVSVERGLRDIDTVIHLAAVTYAPIFFDVPDVTLNVNLMGTLNFLRHHRLFKHFIFFSTAHVYGKQTEFPIKETATPNPIDPYSVSKVAAENLIRVYGQTFGLDYVILRPFNNYGPRQSRRFVTQVLLEQVSRKDVVKIKNDAWRDFLYVKDTVVAVKDILEKQPPQKTYMLSTGQSWKISDIARRTWELYHGEPMPKDHLIVEGKTDRITDIDRLQGEAPTRLSIFRDLQWFPATLLDRGLEETVKWFKDENPSR